jgi:acetamidase/formamidase
MRTTDHRLASNPDTVHWGYFDAAQRPAIEIESGETIEVDCLSGEPADLPETGVLADHRAVLAGCAKGPGPHLLTGPIAVRGAKAGGILQVDILDVVLRQDWGFNLIFPLRGTLPGEFPNFRRLHIPLDRARNVARLPWGQELALKPFCGVMGVAPPREWGRITSLIPRAIGGNIDCKELGPGATLFLPVFVDGANFSAGDGHAVQGDGEVCQTALETAVRATFRLTFRPDLAGAMPWAETDDALIAIGLHEDLDDAAAMATSAMVATLVRLCRLDPYDAYTLCSLAMDLRISQCVDGNKGVHAMFPKASLPAGGHSSDRR